MTVLPVTPSTVRLLTDPGLKFFVFMPRARLQEVEKLIHRQVDRIAFHSSQRRLLIQWRMLDPRFLHRRLISAEVNPKLVDQILLILNRPFTHEEKTRPKSKGYGYEEWQTDLFVQDGLPFVTLPVESDDYD